MTLVLPVDLATRRETSTIVPILRLEANSVDVRPDGRAGPRKDDRAVAASYDCAPSRPSTRRSAGEGDVQGSVESRTHKEGRGWNEPRSVYSNVDGSVAGGATWGERRPSSTGSSDASEASKDGGEGEGRGSGDLAGFMGRGGVSDRASSVRGRSSSSCSDVDVSTSGWASLKVLVGAGLGICCLEEDDWGGGGGGGLLGPRGLTLTPAVAPCLAVVGRPSSPRSPTRARRILSNLAKLLTLSSSSAAGPRRVGARVTSEPPPEDARETTELFLRKAGGRSGEEGDAGGTGRLIRSTSAG